MSHTKEPWIANGNGIHSGVHCVALTQAWEAPVRQTDARRIVACVNACAGISTEGLERGTPIIAANQLLAAMGDEYKQQRDELLAAAKYAKEVLGILWVSHHANRTDAAIEQIDAAISNAEAKP